MSRFSALVCYLEQIFLVLALWKGVPVARLCHKKTNFSQFELEEIAIWRRYVDIYSRMHRQHLMAFQVLVWKCEHGENNILQPEKKASKGRKNYIKTIASCCMNVCGREKGLERILLNQVLVCTQNSNVKLTCRVSRGVSTFFCYRVLQMNSSGLK